MAVLLTLVFLAGRFTPAAADNNSETRLRTNLAGAAIGGKTPGGNAEFRSEPAKGRTRLKVEVQDVNLPAGTMLSVSISHGGVVTAAGIITLNAFGFGELELDSQDGDTVPAVVAGDLVIVMNGGVAILSGTF